MSQTSRITPGYVGVLFTAFLIGVVAGWTPLASRMDGDAYDWMFAIQPPHLSPPQSAVLAIDERTLAQTGGMRNVRLTIARVLDRLVAVHPAAIAIDVILPDEGDAADNAALEAALARSHNVILGSDLIAGAADRSSFFWEDPPER